MRIHRTAGFSLIEILIVITLIGILVSIAVPLYHNYIRTSHRANAKATLAQAAQNMERYFTRNNSYNAVYNDPAGDPPTVGSAPTDEIPQFTDGSSYQLSFIDSDGDGSVADEPNAITYVIQATALGGQAADDCAILTLSQAGVRTGTDKDGNATSTNCW